MSTASLMMISYDFSTFLLFDLSVVFCDVLRVRIQIMTGMTGHSSLQFFLQHLGRNAAACRHKKFSLCLLAAECILDE